MRGSCSFLETPANILAFLSAPLPRMLAVRPALPFAGAGAQRLGSPAPVLPWDFIPSLLPPF